MRDRPTDELRDRFRQLRARDQEQVPAFDRLAPARARGPRRSSALRWTLAAAAAGAALWLGARAFMAGDAVPAVRALDWSTPTAVLLQTPVDPLLRELPQLHTSVIDRFTNLQTQTGLSPGGEP